MPLILLLGDCPCLSATGIVQFFLDFLKPSSDLQETGEREF